MSSDKIKQPARPEARIRGTGSYLPPRVLTNRDLEKMVDTSDQWITERTGIKERRIAEDGVTSSDLGAEAAQIAIAAAGVPPGKIDLIITATVTPDMAFPSTSCLIGDKIKAKGVPAFDIAAACTGYVYSLVIAKHFIQSGLHKNILVVATDKLSAITDWTDRNTCVLFGDGAGAALVSAEGDGPRIGEYYMRSDGSLGDLVILPAGGSAQPATHQTVEEKLHFIKMNGRETFKYAVGAMMDSIESLTKLGGLAVGDIKYIVPHQANMRIISAVARKLGIADEKIHINLDKYGNMSAATSAIGLDETVREKELARGDRVMMVAFGSGFTWGSLILEW